VSINNLLYYIAVFFVIVWVLGFMSYGEYGGQIHILLIIAIIAVLLRVIKGKKDV